MLDSSQFPINLKRNHKIAFVMSKRLGDSLLSMIVVNNLIRHGFDVTVYGDYIYSLKDWFPWATILPKPKTEIKETLLKYDILLHQFSADILQQATTWHRCVKILEESPNNWLMIPMVDIQVKILHEEFLLTNITRDNQIIPPIGLINKKFPNRIVIHPTSYEKKKNWFPEKFLLLAKKLQYKGFQPEFIVSKNDRPDWLWIEKQGFQLPEFHSLAEVASWIYESGWFIGNDSGIGHLASNLEIPTITLGMRKKVMQRWRPAWASGKVLYPPRWLITRPLKEKYWQHFISVKAVLNVFDELILGGS